MRKKLNFFIFLTIFTIFVFADKASAQTSDMGFFGGISEGERLPKTSEIIISNKQNTKPKNKNQEYVYKEMIFIGGEPVEFEGIMTIKSTANIKDTDTESSYKETYSISPSDKNTSDVSLNRDITFNVNYRKEGSQVIKDYEVEKWQESITIPSGSYTLDKDKSEFGISILEDRTPGINYYKGDISQRSVYSKSDGEDETILDVSGSFYGYESPYSSTETHRLDGIVSTDEWQMKYQVRPSVSVNKEIQYSENEPTTISFDGNFREVLQNTSGLEYNIMVKPDMFYDIMDSGKTDIPTYNSFEQLIAPDVSFLQGHPAEYDIKRLFAMEIFDGEPTFFVPDQTITRGEYVTALSKTINLPVKQEDTSKKNKKTPEEIVFPDVTENRPEYPYIMAAYDAGLAVGRDNGNFYTDSPIDRQEAIVTLMRAMGLENIDSNLEYTNKFADDYNIADWAKKEVYAAYEIGIIGADENGNFNPTQNVSKSEVAAYLNRLIDYMSNDLVKDYTEHIVSYTL